MQEFIFTLDDTLFPIHVRKMLKKRRKCSPEVVATLSRRTSTRKKGRRGLVKAHPLRVLLDSGASGNVVKRHYAAGCGLKNLPYATQWATAAGKFKTKSSVKLTFQLPEFDHHKDVTQTFHVADLEAIPYDMIIGQETL